MTALPARLLAVTDRHQARRPLPEIVADLLTAGVRWIWLRDRDLPDDRRRALADALVALTRPARAALTIGADMALAEVLGADGVQLRQASEVAEARRRLGPGALLGVSAHSLDDVRAAAGQGADYVTLSPIFASASKPGYGPALSVAAIEGAAAIGIPILALGGVTVETAQSCLSAGAGGIAVMGLLMDARQSRVIAAAGEVLKMLGEVPQGQQSQLATRSGSGYCGHRGRDEPCTS